MPSEPRLPAKRQRDREGGEQVLLSMGTDLRTNLPRQTHVRPRMSHAMHVQDHTYLRQEYPRQTCLRPGMPQADMFQATRVPGRHVPGRYVPRPLVPGYACPRPDISQTTHVPGRHVPRQACPRPHMSQADMSQATLVPDQACPRQACSRPHMSQAGMSPGHAYPRQTCSRPGMPQTTHVSGHACPRPHMFLARHVPGLMQPLSSGAGKQMYQQKCIELHKSRVTQYTRFCVLSLSGQHFCKIQLYCCLWFSLSLFILFCFKYMHDERES